MGNEHSSASLLVKQHFGPGRKMSKAQSSTVLAEISREESNGSNSLIPRGKDEQRRANGGTYIKKQQKQQRRKPGEARLGTERTQLEKRGSCSSSSGGSQDQDYSSGSGTSAAAVVVGTAQCARGAGNTCGTPIDSKTASSHHQPWLAKHRKDSGCSDQSLTSRSATEMQKRIRSTSVCVSQMMKADCQAIANLSYQHALGHDVFKNGRKCSSAASQGVMPSLTRLRIQQCFRNAKPLIGHHVLKRACTLRPEFKSFLGHLREEKADELANDIFVLVTECVANVELPSKVAATSFAFGEMHAQLCNAGFRPDFFSVIADATIAECVRLDGGAQKRCETLMAWSQLMQFMFSNVRDGYYAEVRQQRRSSLPQQRLLLKKQINAAKQQQQMCLSVDSRETADITNRSAIRNGSITPVTESMTPNTLSASLKDRRRAMLMQQNISFDMDI